LEWEFAKQIAEAATQLKAKEIISIEGVNVMMPTENTVFGYGNKRFIELGAEDMKESIIMGVSAALLLRSKITSCLFAQAHSTLPDSKAAADVIRFLDEYLDIKIAPTPLEQQAEQFEQKLKTIMRQANAAEGDADKKNLSYLG